ARGLEEVGLYSAAFRFLMLAMVVVDSFVNSLFPIISNYYRHAAEGSRDQFEVACKKGLQLLLVLTVPVALALSLLADQIILLVYGEKYIGAIPALRILIWVVVPYAISQIFAYALVASNNQRYDFFVNAVSMVCNMMLNWILIQQFGYIGAAWSAALAILIYVAVQVPFVLHRVLTFDVKRLLFGGLKVVIATVLMAIFILFFPQIKIWFLVPLAFVLYLLTLIAAKTFSRNDWLLATRLLK
ncbi:MAG: polysaccharide biosynthesis C-terminal domain-containing protein, partial [candidate division KSB1 bacterium]|nr:polysaccharide biosynthesis C-terminal domain-containing protein [candidate division KSB1 bacterium]